MTPDELVVVVGSALAIAWIVWYFWLGNRS
jgi:hypothetical protein